MDVIFDLAQSTFRLFLPLGFLVLGGVMSERAGIAQIALEGFLLIGALAAAATASLSGSGELAILAAVLAGAFFAMLHAFFSVALRSDQIVVGMAINLLVFGSAPFLTQFLFGTGGSTPSIDPSLRAPTSLILLFVGLTAGSFYLLEKTRLGLFIKFAGENPGALQASGYRASWVRAFSLLFCGAVSGLGGAVLTLMLASHYSPMMSAGRGFIALAAIIIGGWRLGPALGAAALFALTDAVQIRIQGHVPVPGVFVQILPYVVAILALMKGRKSSQVPEALGRHV